MYLLVRLSCQANEFQEHRHLFLPGSGTAQLCPAVTWVLGDLNSGPHTGVRYSQSYSSLCCNKVSHEK